MKSMFRFHTGSIKSVSQMNSEKSVNSFDSILVRLKAYAIILQTTTQGFRFHTGSIKSSTMEALANFYYSFDSILVRLKVPSRVGVSYQHVQVSIPYWFD